MNDNEPPPSTSADDADPQGQHVSVMLDRCVDLLAPAVEEPGVIVDCTLGLGGHSEAILERLPAARVIGIDRDPEAREAATCRLARFGDRFTAVAGVFDEIADIVTSLGHTQVAGVLMDLGVSSLQLDSDDRGFAYSRPAPLDMRMNPEDDLTAAKVLATYSEKDLAHILRVYGEEKFAHGIARRVVATREESPLLTSDDLMAVLDAAIPAAVRRKGGHPGKKTFQALRIEVNDELGAIERALPAAARLLRIGGRLVVMSFQSLEDKIVKRYLASLTTSSAPPDLPVVPDSLQPTFSLLTRGAEQATPAEIAVNPRATSVRLRAAVRTKPGFMRSAS